MPEGTVCTAECTAAPSVELYRTTDTATGKKQKSDFTCVDGVWVGELQCPGEESKGDQAWGGNEVTLKDGHFYRAMSELYPMAGGLQRAAASSYCGLRGYMATPESLEEAKLIGRVVQGSTRNNGTSRVETFTERGPCFVSLLFHLSAFKAVVFCLSLLEV